MIPEDIGGGGAGSRIAAPVHGRAQGCALPRKLRQPRLLSLQQQRGVPRKKKMVAYASRTYQCRRRVCDARGRARASLATDCDHSPRAKSLEHWQST